jgi:tripeptidyl-peptidase-1
MVVLTSVILGSLLVLAFAKPPVRSGMVVRSSKSSAPEGFAHLGAAPGDKSIPLRLALVQGDMAGLEKALYDVSTPGNTNYGKHLSKEQV